MNIRNLEPAERVEPDPAYGWSGADVTDDERVDDFQIRALAGRVYKPLMPKDEKLFKTGGRHRGEE